MQENLHKQVTIGFESGASFFKLFFENGFKCCYAQLHVCVLITKVPSGGTRSIHDRGPTYFFGLKIYALGIILGQEICHIFFSS